MLVRMAREYNFSLTMNAFLSRPFSEKTRFIAIALASSVDVVVVQILWQTVKNNNNNNNNNNNSSNKKLQPTVGTWMWCSCIIILARDEVSATSNILVYIHLAFPINVSGGSVVRVSNS